MSLQGRILQALAQGPRTLQQLKRATGATGKKLGQAMKTLLEKQRVQAVRGGYALGENRGTAQSPLAGTVPARMVKVGRGFGFAAPLDGSGDIFVPARGLHGVMVGDGVEIGIYSKPRIQGSREGEVLRVIQANQRLVGRVIREEKQLYIAPVSMPERPIPLEPGGEDGAQAGERVAALIVQRGERYSGHLARVVQRFGEEDSAADSAQAILYAAGIEAEFPKQVLAQANAVAAEQICTRDIEGRRDLRDETIFTIDSASTKDIDDAISVKRDGEGYVIGVHIADVSHYVRVRSQLDEEALKRGTSIYYADSVVPMLPPQLSNGICSLNAGEDRLAFSCEIRLDSRGETRGFEFYKSVVRSCIKGVYAEINLLLKGENDADLQQKYAPVEQELEILHELYQKLATLRVARGSMEIDSDEPRLELNENGICVGVEPRSRGEAERLIEEMMLLANTAAASLAKQEGLPFVYRVHDKPSLDKAQQLEAALTAAGVEFGFEGELPTQRELGRLLDETRDTPLAKFVHTGVLRSMAKAKYEPMPKGHYGLALEDYAHFTSPIRRYPDLAIHRILSDFVGGVSKDEIAARYLDFAQKAAQRSSETELTAQRIERDCDECYKAEYMKAFIGQVFEGVVSSAAQFGVYVQLENTVEGLVHISRLQGGHWELQDGVALRNPVLGVRYRIGDAVKVRLLAADIATGNVDFDLAE